MIHPRVIYPKVLPWLIHRDAQRIAAPFALLAVFTTAYLETLREMLP